MGGRRRFLRTTLAALAALVLLAGAGAGVWIASSDEDDSPLAFADEQRGEDDAPGQPAPGEEANGGDEPSAGEPDAGAEPSAPGEEPPAGEEPSAPGEPPSAGDEPSAGAEPIAPEASPPETAESAPTVTARPGKPNTTRFPRERNEDPSRSGKRFSVPPAHEFTGTGNTLIGTVDVRQPALVRWTARGNFGLEFGREAFPIIAPSRSGQLVVPPYRFELVRVLAKGRWTITVTPQR